MKPYNVYFIDFVFRLIYIFFSFLLCFILFFNHINTVFLFETFPLLFILSKKRFILTQITQLFNILWFYCNFLSFLFTFPLIIYYVNLFFNSSWYHYQITLYKLLTNLTFFIFVSFYFLTHITIIPNVLEFLLYWEIVDEYSLLKIEAEISLFFYIIWSLRFKFVLAFVLSNLFFLLLLTFSILKTLQLYILIQKFKKILIFIVLCFLFFLIPPDFWIQLILTLISYILIEFLFLLICINFYNKIRLKTKYQCQQ